MNFQKLDLMVSFQKKAKVYSDALDQGYIYISEWVYDMYYSRCLSLREVSVYAGVHLSTVNRWMTKWGYASRPKGGNHKNKKIIGNDDYILSLKGKCSSKEAAKLVGCATSTILVKWRTDNPKKVVAEKPKIPKCEYPLKINRSEIGSRHGRGINSEIWEQNHRSLELEAWRAHKGETPTPIPNEMMRLGDLYGI